MTPLPLALQMPGLTEWIVIAVIGLLFFGKRLPEVGRSLGRGIVEFKKGLKGVEDEIEEASSESRRLPQDQPVAAVLPASHPSPSSMAAPKFDPYTGKPIQPAFDPYTGKPLEETNPATK